MKQLHLLLACMLLGSLQLVAQQKELTHEEFITWQEIKKPQLSNDGKWAVYEQTPELGDGALNIYTVASGKTQIVERATAAKISADSRFIAFKIKPHHDSLIAMRRRKVDKKDLPKDTLGILNLETGELNRIANMKGYAVGKNWGDYLFYQFEPVPPPADTTQQDSTATETPKEAKKMSKDNGYPLLVHQWSSGSVDTLPYVTDFALAEDAAGLVIYSTGDDSTFLAGVYRYDFKERELIALHRGEGDYKQLHWDKQATQVAFLADTDTTEAQVRPFGLYHWSAKQDSAQLLADDSADFLTKTWRISEHGELSFSDNGKHLFFGTATQPILQDTSILDEEIVNVEVWHYKDQYLHTQQEVNLKNEKKRSYQAVAHLATKTLVQLGDEDVPNIELSRDQNNGIALGEARDQYGALLSWEGFPQRRDLYKVDVQTGKRERFGTAVRGGADLSPQGKYVSWYSTPDSAWFAYDFATNKQNQLNETTQAFYDELNDRPMYPYPAGSPGWTSDEELLIYDRFDIWKADPSGKQALVRLTNGRETNKIYRYVRLDREEYSINTKKPMLLRVFDETSKGSGYASLDLKTGTLKSLHFDENYTYSTRPVKAKDADVLLTTRQNFRTFPDLQLSNTKFSKLTKISDANPQQKDYKWGTIELYEWTSLDGQKLQGQLVKPDNFDPTKKYPLLVNFYERSSNRLHRYRTPRPGRSTINYSFYASKGYVIFNPDVPYRVGYPGESAYNAVLPGVTALINEGFIDEKRIGVQGHSWGGYQVAYLVTKTDIFACAESGAPVVNMISAYGGIRWRSGLSRMFQYEHTQSRIGGTIWETPMRYIENSPIFFVDKINTPVLILHNDKDGAVPWYQGIEWFVAMRRLNKPAWLLNYNDEPHWPVKLQNRRDFQQRMQQFFDHYLLEEAAPSWMKRGVPAIEKGIRQGLD